MTDRYGIFARTMLGVLITGLHYAYGAAQYKAIVLDRAPRL